MGLPAMGRFARRGTDAPVFSTQDTSPERITSLLSLCIPVDTSLYNACQSVRAVIRGCVPCGDRAIVGCMVRWHSNSVNGFSIVDHDFIGLSDIIREASPQADALASLICFYP